MQARLVFALALVLAQAALAAEPVAFPGAEGYGKAARGGRGGRVIQVTRLDDAADTSGRAAAGTLRACVEAAGPRVCVFRQGGSIVLTRGPLLVRQSFLTIAGQTAPGGGVLVTHDGGPAARTPIVVKGASDVVIRHLRSRPIPGPYPDSNDAFTIEDAQRVVLDHVSGSWAEDEGVNLHAGSTDVTVSWSLLAEGLMPHSKCALLSSDPLRPQRITFARNLCASNNDRNPDLQAMPGSCLDVINNVFYNANGEFTEIWGSHGGTWANVAGNAYRRGPNTNHAVYALLWQGIGATGTPRLYSDGNLADGARITLIEPELEPFLVPTPVCPLSAARNTAAKAYVQVLDRAGAFPRDAVDARIVNEVTSRTGGLKNAPGTMPALLAGTSYPDADADGMSDSWESRNGLNPAQFDAWARVSDGGFLALDRFLDHAHQQRLSGAAVQ